MSKTFKVKDPKDSAFLLSAIVAVDKGIPTDTMKTDEGWVVLIHANATPDRVTFKQA
jgi:hypothetical protein